jgi:hypothetical protein
LIIALVLMLMLVSLLLLVWFKKTPNTDEQRVRSAEHRQKGDNREQPRHHVGLVRHLGPPFLNDFTSFSHSKRRADTKTPDRPRRRWRRFMESQTYGSTFVNKHKADEEWM